MRRPRVALALMSVLVAALLVGCGDDDDAAREPGGPAAVTAEAERLNITGGTSTLRLDPSTVASLQREGIEIIALPPATTSGDGIAFEVVHGGVHPETFLGVVNHGQGGFAFERDGERVGFSELVVSTGAGFISSDGRGARIAELELAELAAERSGDTVVARGMEVLLGEVSSEVLRNRFDERILRPGLPLGTLTTRVEVEPAG